jgi:lipopolysaccharide export system permease protein
MGIIFRYLAKEIYITMLAVTGILVFIFTSHQFIHYLGDAAAGKLTPKAVLQMLCVQVPLLLGFMLPLGFFLGTLLALGRMYTDNEMTIFTACGVSKAQILKMHLGLACVIALLVGFIMFWLEPKMAWYRNQIIARAAVSSPIEKVSPGRFQQVGNWVLYSEAVTRDRQTMANVFAAALPNRIDPHTKASLDVVTAQKAFQKVSSLKETFIVLSKGYRYIGNPGKNDFQIIQFREYGVRLPNNRPIIGKVEQFMSWRELWAGQVKNPIAAAELQWRIAMPISVLILALFAVPLSEVKPRQGRFSKFLQPIIIYIIYLNLLFLGRNWIEKSQVSYLIGLWWIHGIMLMLAGIILYSKLSWRKAW